MEKLVFFRKARLIGSEVYCEWSLLNEGLENAAVHGATLPINITVTDTLDAYEPKAKAEINIAIQNLFPNMYEL